jgi:integrase
MASIKIILRTDKRKSSGESPLFIRLTHARSSKYISLGIYVKTEEWNEKKQCVKKIHPNASQINRFIGDKVNELQSNILRLETAQEPYTAGSLIQKDRLPTQSFLAYADNIARQFSKAGKERSWLKYDRVIGKLRKFLDSTDLLFHQITVGFLREYETCLRSLGNGDSTVNTDLRTIRAILYRAMDEGLFPQEKNPFFKYKLKTPKPAKAKLTIAEIKQLEELVLPENSAIWHIRNYFLFAYYCAGLRFSDLLLLTWQRVQDGRLTYVMAKTGTQRSLKLSDKAAVILNHYWNCRRKRNEYVFPLMDPIDLKDKRLLVKICNAKNSFVNKYLKILAVKARIPKRLSFHISRHSFADIARKKKLSIYDISKALGHTDIKTTELYLSSLDFDSLDDAMDVFGQEDL